MTLQDTSLPVLVLHMEHHGALGVMRSLGRLGVRMYGVHSTPGSPASFSKYCQKAFVLDLEQTPTAQSVDYLKEIGRSIGKPLLLPTNDESALFVARNVAPLQEDFLFPANAVQVSGRSTTSKRCICWRSDCRYRRLRRLFPGRARKSSNSVRELNFP